MPDWKNIDTVLLDMDGTLLDLNFDNYFWRQHVPLRYAEKMGSTVEEAKKNLFPVFKDVEGTINWYCVDYWSERLGLDIAMLKEEVDHLIAIHPHVIDFLERLEQTGKQRILVTNAHHKSLMLKLDRTALHDHLDEIVCAHDYGLPKENPEFWQKLQLKVPFDKQYTLLAEDSLPVLHSARRYGIAHLLGIRSPDSQGPHKDMEDFPAVVDFSEVMP